ncbi:putative acetyltransferase [Actinacidiphila reveromycinica]|uniref:Putative acetyltransferase n=1 Tax=Actinacidiphila reveromycinica TaxID=659352 RepID=A0A7U3VSK6_9ACTN|nr:GNAT family N-acetyltransferase [Streptomyces sp. SN-593]BBB01840.1 putative acetyltransferase [Streptomyces sp. SN-593]
MSTSPRTTPPPSYAPLPQDPARTPGAHVLDNAAWASMSGEHRHLAEFVGRAGRYLRDVSPFVAVADPADPRAWADLAELVGPGNSFTIAGLAEPPAGWVAGEAIAGVQLVATTLRGEPDPEAVPLGPADVPEMLDLVARTQPGPFLPRTVEMGAYHGIRRAGALVAMAGERLHPPGWTEISAVCTDPDHRGHGLATRLVRHVAAGIGARGDTPFLHAAAANTSAIRLYESIGFTLRRTTFFRQVRVPDQAAPAPDAVSAPAPGPLPVPPPASPLDVR